MEENYIPVETPVEIEVKRKRKAPPPFYGFLIGGLIGAGIALLSAPYSGQETRNRLREKSIEIKDKAVETAQETRNKIGDAARQGTERVTSIKERGQSVLNEQKKNVESAVVGIREGVRTYVQEGQQAGETSLTTNINTTEIMETKTDISDTGPYGPGSAP
jgi:gas vesicle protein